jgi:hypothetical protein
MKQETLEEALLEDIKFLLLAKSDALAIRLIEKYGHNKQQERSYSEEDMREAFKNGAFKWRMHSGGKCFDKWFEKFKKKEII